MGGPCETSWVVFRLGYPGTEASQGVGRLPQTLALGGGVTDDREVSLGIGYAGEIDASNLPAMAP